MLRVHTIYAGSAAAAVEYYTRYLTETPGSDSPRGFGLVGEGVAAAADFGDDLFGGAVPDERAGVVVPVFGPLFDCVGEFGDVGERTAT